MRATQLALIAVALAAASACGSITGHSAPTETATTPSVTTPLVTTPSVTTPSVTKASSTASPTIATTTTVSANGPRFAPIVEPFDPGHPATTRPDPGNCGAKASTIDIEQCFETRTETTDAAIDAAQVTRFDAGPSVTQAAILSNDKAWLAARGPVCKVAFHSGGTIDGIDTASCLLDESSARLDAVKNVTRPLTRLASTDNVDPSGLSWYTAPDGSRIGEVDSQGDQTGGAIISWIVVGGPDGFVVDPSAFTFTDRAFVDKGILQPPNPTGHRVPTGVEYMFSLDYSRLSADPGDAKRAGGYLYAPGGVPTAIWGSPTS